LPVYSVLFVLFLFIFAGMWTKEVNALGWMMFIRHDPAFAPDNLIVFSALALIIISGFIYVNRNYRLSKGNPYHKQPGFGLNG